MKKGRWYEHLPIVVIAYKSTQETYHYQAYQLCNPHPVP